MKIAVAAILSAVCAVALADPDSRWFNAGETADVKTYIQRGSLEQTITFAVAPGSSTSDSIAFTDVLEGRLTPPGSNQ